ncbi:MAG: hypothetical protein U5K27_10270 [Desulfotignum sp.]|nr:hypothetical protein [Desulfotignum sp.]
MAKDTCPVQSTLQYLSERDSSGVLKDPKVRRICESIRMLVEEIIPGRGRGRPYGRH